MNGKTTQRAGYTVLCNVAVPLGALLLAGMAYAVPVGYVSFDGTNSYTQDFATLPYNGNVQAYNGAGATIAKFSPNTTLGSATEVTYTLPSTNVSNSPQLSFSFSDSTLGAITGGGNAAIASGMDGWWGQVVKSDRLAQNDGSIASSFTGGMISLGVKGSPARALGVVSSSTSGAATAALALQNNSGSPIGSVTISLAAQLWCQTPSQKYLNFSYTLAPSSSITANSSGGAAIPTTTIYDANLSPAFIPAAHGTPTTFTDPVSAGTLSDTITLSTPWASGDILWLEWTTFAGGTITTAPGGDGIFGTATGGIASGTSTAQQIGLSSLSISVPEPATLSVLGLSSGLVLLRRRRV